MNIRSILLTLSFYLVPGTLWAADVASMSPTGGVLKMVLGLAIVLAVMALVTWALKRMMPGAGGQQSAMRIVGGVSVGSRERVVVLEVAGRWLVVGVAPGQVSAIANLEIGSSQLSENVVGSSGAPNTSHQVYGAVSQTFAPSFAQWLKKSAVKFTENTNAK